MPSSGRPPAPPDRAPPEPAAPEPAAPEPAAPEPAAPAQRPLLEVAPQIRAPIARGPRWIDPVPEHPHTDTVPMAVPAACFALPWARLAECRDPDGFVGHAMARRAVLLALRSLVRRPRRDVPPAFTVSMDFCGADRAWLVVGVEPSSAALEALLDEHLDFFAERETGAAARARVGHDGLSPCWRLDGRHLICYAGEGAAGSAVTDGPEGLRTGLVLHRRVAARAPAQVPAAFGVLAPAE